MIKKNFFFKDYFLKSNNFKKNKQKTKKVYKSLLNDIKNSKIPLLQSFQNDYQLDFSRDLVKKFSKYKNIIIFGMGGSILGTKSIFSFFEKKIKKNIFFFDNLDVNLIKNYHKIKNLKNSCFIVISKSGNTIETIKNLNLIFKKILFKNKLIVITEISDSTLMNLANKLNAEIIEHKEFIGGRYSVLSETGMFPATLMGLKVKKFKNLNKLIKNKNFVSALIENVAGIFTLNQKGINNSVIFSYDSNLNNLGYWYQQLVGESLGKKGFGINPTLSFGPKDHHSLLQLYLDGPRDKFFTFLNFSEEKNKERISNEIIPQRMKFMKKNLKFIVSAQCQAVKSVFKSKKIPYREINFKYQNEEELGNIFTFFVIETILLSRLFKINPFDQPSVEQVKKKTKEILT